ncbi:uncharacterized protein LOC116794180 isoform X2 [Chiroxiphia lanceolata]|nr:uncharacterized protein LOC116794180 isoform X2 [Chiroxiphia lanceolata]
MSLGSGTLNFGQGCVGLNISGQWDPQFWVWLCGSGCLWALGPSVLDMAVWVWMSLGSGTLNFGQGCVGLDVSGHWDPQFWTWQCSGSNNPAPHGSEVGQLEQHLAASWKPGLPQGSSPGMSPSCTGLLEHLGCVFPPLFVTGPSQSKQRHQRAACSELLDPPGEKKAQAEPLGHLPMENRQWGCACTADAPSVIPVGERETAWGWGTGWTQGQTFGGTGLSLSLPHLVLSEFWQHVSWRVIVPMALQSWSSDREWFPEHKAGPWEGQADAMSCLLPPPCVQVGLLCEGTFSVQTKTNRPKEVVRKANHLPALRLPQLWV